MRVPSVRVKGAKIALVGEAPGETEHLNGVPFIGKAGRVLDKTLSAGGLRRDEVSIYNVVTRAPDGGFDSEAFRKTFYETTHDIIIAESALKRCADCNKTARKHKRGGGCEFRAAIKTTTKQGKKHSRPTAELVGERERLKKELIEDRPNVVVALGAEALKTLVADASNISDERGSVLESTLIPGLKVIPMLHPAAILRGAQWQEHYINGCIVRKKVVPESKRPDLMRQGWEVIEPTLAGISKFCQMIRDKGEMWTLDIETRGGSIACIGIGMGNSAMCIPIQTTSGPYWGAAEEMAVWKHIQKAMENPNLIGQNILYDLYWLLEDYGILPSGILMDTMLAFHSMYPELPKGLGFLTMWYTDMPYYKDEGKTWGKREPDQNLWAYNIKDIIAQLRVGTALMEELKAKGLWEKYVGFVNPQLEIALEMMYRGFDADERAIMEARGIVVAEKHRIHKLLVEAVGEVDTASPIQVMRVLYDQLKLPRKVNRKTKKATGDEDAIMELVGEFPDQKALKLILAERHLDKALDSYIDVRLYEREGATGNSG